MAVWPALTASIRQAGVMKHTTAEEKQSFRAVAFLLPAVCILNAERIGQILPLREEDLAVREDKRISFILLTLLYPEL